MLLRDRYPGLTHQLLRQYVGISHDLVRGDVQINEATERAKGRRLLPAEVVCAFGEETYKKIVDDGAAVIQARSNASSITIMDRLQSLGLSMEDLAERMNMALEKLKSYLGGHEYFPIRLLERACFHLGLDDARISAETAIQSNPRLRLRYYDKKQDEHKFRKEIVFEIAEEAWKLQKLSYLRALISSYEGEGAAVGRQNLEFIDGNYFLEGAQKPTVKKGEILAKKARQSINSGFRKGRQVNLYDTFMRVGVPAFVDRLPEDYSGMTIVNSWDDSRSVVANLVGKNSAYEIMRFTLAHELGHAICDPSEQFVELRVGDSAGASAGRSRDSARVSRDYPELRANAFAISFLAPEDEVKSAILEAAPDANLEEVLGRKFGISASAAGYRLEHFAASRGNHSRFNMFFNQEASEDVPSLDECLMAAAVQAVQCGLIHQDTAASIRQKLDLKHEKDEAGVGYSP